jgi:hypothetical protein
MVATKPALVDIRVGSNKYMYAIIIPQKDMYGLRFPQSITGNLSDIVPNTGLMHHGAEIIPTLRVISTGVKRRLSIISKFMAMPPKLKQNPKVK